MIEQLAKLTADFKPEAASWQRRNETVNRLLVKIEADLNAKILDSAQKGCNDHGATDYIGSRIEDLEAENERPELMLFWRC